MRQRAQREGQLPGSRGPHGVCSGDRASTRTDLEGWEGTRASGPLRHGRCPRGLPADSVIVWPGEDRRLREGGPGGRCGSSHRSSDAAARPFGRGGAQRLRRQRSRGGAARQGVAGGGGGGGRLARSGPGARLAAQGARDGRRPGDPRRRRRRGGLGPRRHQPRACEGARARAGRPRPLRPAVLRFRRRRPVGGGRRPAAAAADLAGGRADGRGGEGDGETPDGVRLRPDRGAAPGRRRRLRRDQRAPVSVAEGDHGREVEAAGDGRVSATSACRRATWATKGRERRYSRSATLRRGARAERSRTTAPARSRSSTSSWRRS